MLMYPTVYRYSMTQETIEEFVKRTQDESVKLIASLSGFAEGEARRGNPSGMSLADLGLKIATEQGKLEVLQHVEWLINPAFHKHRA